MVKVKRYAWVGLICGLLSLLGSPWAVGCAVPVFRYALERDAWEPALYPVVVFRKGALSEQEQEALHILETARDLFADYLYSSNRDFRVEFPANIDVWDVDVTQPIKEPHLKKLWESLSANTFPQVILGQPYQQDEIAFQPIWQGSFSPKMAWNLIDSPVRREVVRRLAQGAAAVWILVEGTDPTETDLAEKDLLRETTSFATNFEMAPDVIKALNESMGGTFQLRFEVVRLNPNDPREAFLLRMLRHFDPETATTQRPVAFPVFGRGRVLQGLIGKQIEQGQIEDTCLYMAGDCSCEIKWKNPGIDLLMSADWYKVLAGVAPPSWVNSSSAQEAPQGFLLWLVGGLLVGLMTIVTFVVTIMQVRKNRRA